MSRPSSFYYSFLVLPKAKRRAVLALFDFCRAVDDAVDLESDPVRASAALEVWRQEVARLFADVPATRPETRALAPFVRAYGLPRVHFDALLDGVTMDVTPRRYQTFADVERYCHGVASAVGLLCAPIFGYSNPAALDYARDLGVALQLTNILRDVAADLGQGRLYLPLEDLARFRCSEDDLRREIANAGQGVQASCVRALLEGRPPAPGSSSTKPIEPSQTLTGRASWPPRLCAPSTGASCAELKPATATCSAGSFGCRVPYRPGSPWASGGAHASLAPE